MAKKIFSIFLSIALLLSTMSFSAFAETAVDVKVTSEKNTFSTNDIFTVTVSLGAVTGVAGIDAKLYYDSSKVEYQSGAVGTFGSNFAVKNVTAESYESENWVDGNFATDSKAIDNNAESSIFTATFKVIASETCEVPLDLKIKVIDTDYEQISTNITKFTAYVSIPLTSVTASVDQPVKGTALDTTVDTSGATAYTAAVKWYEGNSVTGTPVEGTAKAETVYTAKITLTANTGESFADSLNNTITDGYKITKVSDTELTLVKTFEKTADKDALAGKPTITGIGTDNIPRIGDTLTANVTALNDGTNITYQWFAGDNAIESAQNKDYTLTTAEKGKTIKVKITANPDSEYKGMVESDATAAVQKKKCTTEATEPTLSATDVKVTVTNVAEGHEYAIAENNTAVPTSDWQTSGEFSNLQPNKTYYVYSRVAENETTLAGEAKSVSVMTTKSTAPAPTAPSVSGKTDTTIAVAKADGQKYMIKLSTEAAPTNTETGWLDTVNFTGLTANTTYKIYTYAVETETYFASDVVSTEVTTDKTSVNATLIPVTDLTSKIYNAMVQEPTFGGALTSGTDYTVTYTPSSKGTLSDAGKPVGAGTYTVTIEGKGNYTGSFTKEFVIAPKDVTVTPDSGKTKKYGETDPEFTYTVDLAAEGLKATFDAAKTGNLGREIGEDVNEYKILMGDLAAGDNFRLALNATPVVFTITKADQTISVPTDKQITKNGVTVDIKNWASTNASADGAALKYTLGGTYTGVSLSGTELKVEQTATVESISIKVTSAATKNYSAAAEATMTVAVVDKLSADVTITNAPTSMTYGDENFKLKASVGTGVTGGTWSWSTDTTGTFEIVGNRNTDEVTVKVLKANTVGATLTATYTSDTHYGTNAATIKVEQKEVTVEKGSYKVSKVYNGTDNAGTVSGALEVSGILDADVNVKATPAAYTNANVGGQTTMDVNIELEGTGKENYKIKDNATTVNVPCEITPADLTVTGTGTATGSYGDKLEEITAFSGLSVSFNGENVAGTWRFSGTDIPDAETETYLASFTPTAGAGNYNALTKNVTLTISKADYKGTVASINVSQKYSVESEQTVSVTDPVSKVVSRVASKDAATISGTATVAEFSVTDLGVVTYKITGGTAGTQITLPLVITSKNYNDITVNIIVTLTARDDQAALNITSADTVTYGQTLNLTAQGGSGAGEVTFAVVSGGTGTATISGNVLTPTKAGTVKVQATKAADTDYNEKTSDVVNITIAKATPTVTPNFVKVTESGKKLSDANLTATSTPEGTIAWNEDAAATEVEANKAYSWTFTPTDTDNYNTVTGTLVVWTKSSGGGGGFAAPTVQKPEIVIDETQGKAELSNNGTTASITANEGYEIEKVTVNGVDQGAVDKLTGLKTGDKVVISFKSTAPAADDNDAVVKQLTSKISKLQIVARSVKTSKKNVKVTLKTDDQTNAAIKEIKSLGYTVKYKFYRSTKKSSSYKAVLTKTSKTYTNTKGVKGTKYYYKARVQVFDKDGKLVAQTALKQCKYASRTWSK